MSYEQFYYQLEHLRCDQWFWKRDEGPRAMCHWFEMSRLKNGKPGKKVIEQRVWYSPLRTCQLCGFTSGFKKVRYRGDVHGWNLTDRKDYETPLLNILCMGCWNKARAIRNAEIIADEIKTANNRLQREYREAKRNQSRNQNGN